ncbi:DUF4920 domain-containing protein [Xanthomonadaceae bacterium JHOS43]|nr:DUF4920 domain-containing protein [Xanthomonadaceae bacterium JHOS43]MCX7563450.1 DUF4920 domain-containing protein [Xanthomonadaceae bacterium XH05]
MFLRKLSLSLLLTAPLALAGASDLADAPEGWGEPVPAGKALALDAALATFNPANTEPGVYQGRIVDVCEKRGCWAKLELDGHSARVMPRDHGFMVPRDVRGMARVYGVLLSEDLSEASAKYAEEHPGEPNPIPVREFRIDALGIVMVEGS